MAPIGRGAATASERHWPWYIMSIVRCRTMSVAATPSWARRSSASFSSRPKAASIAAGSASAAAGEIAFGKIMLHVDQQAAQRRGDAGIGRHDHCRNRQFPGDRGAVQRAGAAEGDQREIARIIAAADRDQPHRIRHVGVGDADDRVRGRLARQAERIRRHCLHRLSAASAGSSVILPPARLVPSRPSTTLASVLVGPLIAVAVTGGTRIGAGRLRAVAQRARFVDPGERAAAGADGQDFDRGKADRIAELDDTSPW